MKARDALVEAKYRDPATGETLHIVFEMSKIGHYIPRAQDLTDIVLAHGPVIPVALSIEGLIERFRTIDKDSLGIDLRDLSAISDGEVLPAPRENKGFPISAFAYAPGDKKLFTVFNFNSSDVREVREMGDNQISLRLHPGKPGPFAGEVFDVKVSQERYLAAFNLSIKNGTKLDLCSMDVEKTLARRLAKK